MILDGTSEVIRAVLAGAAATNQCQFFASFTDVDDDDATPTFVPSNNDGLSNDTTPVNIVPAPAAGIQRQVTHIAFYNADTASVTVTFDFYDGTNSRIIAVATLATLERAEWHGDKWRLYDATGVEK